MKPRYHVYVSDRGNVFMTEIAALLAASLNDLGYETVFPAPGLPESSPTVVNLVVAPHEFFPLQRGVADPVLLRAAEASVLVGVEQPGTSWFELGARFASVARAVLDINELAVAELDRRGIDSRHLQLGYHKTWDHWGGQVNRSRPTDVLFLGSVTPRRGRALSAAADLLWDCVADIRLFEFPRPMTDPKGNFVASSDKWDLLASSRVLLNIHRNDVPYFEWVRVLEAVTNGCLVVSESSVDYGPLTPGTHLIAAPVEFLGAYATSLLVDEELRSDITSSAYEFVRSKVSMNAVLEDVCGDLDSGGHPVAPRHHPPPTASAPPSLPEVYRPIAATLDPETRIRGRIKQLIDSETVLIRRVEALESRLDWGDESHVEVEVTPAWDEFVPDVSVVVTSYNTAEFVGRAMRSILAVTGVAAELVVVDDHSHDRSLDTIKAVMTETPCFPILLAARTANVGLSSARNSALAHTRSDYIFILDSDNVVYPTGLEKLTTALEKAPDAAFSYGILAKSDGSGLLSYMPWDVLRLCEANYIDAMALIRRSILDEVGGYDPYFGLRGWEDYELWLRLAAAGHRGEFISQIIGSYYVRTDSLLSVVNLDTTSLIDELHERFPFLPWC